jgi:hypothetical protein
MRDGIAEMRHAADHACTCCNQISARTGLSATFDRGNGAGVDDKRTKRTIRPFFNVGDMLLTGVLQQPAHVALVVDVIQPVSLGWLGANMQAVVLLLQAPENAFVEPLKVGLWALPNGEQTAVELLLRWFESAGITEVGA